MHIQNAYYLIIDLEATCSNDGGVPREEMEIIEIGAVMMSSRTYEVEAEFSSFVRPVQNPHLTEFCTELTTIRQDQVDAAASFPVVLREFTTWMHRFDDALFCSWGDYDRSQFERDCEFHDVRYPFESGHFNVKEAFAQTFSLRKKLGVDAAVRRLGLKFQGTHHRGLDDARNIAQIVRRVCIGA
ncbi:MAG TPA: 3'-5' exonuclease [Pirellulales bacterium]